MEKIEAEGKLIDRIAYHEMKKTAQSRDELSKHIFTVGFKMAYRYLTGNEIRYRCITKCNTEDCSCSLPKTQKE